MSAASDDLWSTTRDDFTGDLFGDQREAVPTSTANQPVEILASASSLYKQRKLQPESMEVIIKALGTDAVARRILAKGESLATGQCIGVRLNLNVLKSTGVAVHTIHRATSTDGHTKGRGFYRGEVLSYQPVVVLKDVYFNVHQAGRQGIASGAMNKHPMASCDGLYQPTDDTLTFDGVELSFNPKRVHLFTDEEGFAVQYAQEVTIMGHRAYARKTIRYFSQASAPEKVGDAPSSARFKS
jgi:hypothetical protein